MKKKFINLNNTLRVFIFFIFLSLPVLFLNKNIKKLVILRVK